MSDLVSRGAQLPAAPAEHGDKSAADNPRREIIIGLCVILAFFGGFLGWASFAPLDAAAVAPGVVVVSGNRQSVQHLTGGKIDEILAHDGDSVNAGDLLVELDTDELETQLRQLRSRLITLHAREARLLAEQQGLDQVEPGPWLSRLDGQAGVEAERALAAEQAQFTSRGSSLKSQIDVLQQRKVQTEQRIEGYQAQIASNRERVRLVEDQLEGTLALYEKELAPLTRVRDLQSNIAALQGEDGSLTAQIAASREQMSELDLQITNLRQELNTDVSSRLVETQREIAEVEPQYDAIALRLDRSEIRAPVSGRIVNSSVFTDGGVISPGQVLMEVVPTDRPLVIRAQIEPAYADNVRAGQSAEVRFEVARSARENPILFGEVAQMSADRIVDQQTGIPYFLAEITVPQEELRRLEEFLNKDVALRPGYPAEVVIPLRERTMLQYIFEPLTSALWRSFRES